MHRNTSAQTVPHDEEEVTALGISDLIILLAVAAGIALAVVYMRKRKKAGKCIGCSGDCSHCGYKDLHR